MRYGPKRPSLYLGVGEQILLARRRRGWTQRDLGERIGVSHVAVGDIERGKTRVDLDNLAYIADVLGVPLGQLIPSESRPASTGPAAGGSET